MTGDEPTPERFDAGLADETSSEASSLEGKDGPRGGQGPPGEARQHILPAVLIGQFSSEGDLRFRYRKVIVRRRSGGLPIPRSAESLAWQAEYYGPSTPTGGAVSVDPVWKATESALPDVIQALKSAKNGNALSLRLWLWVLVPFVASLFARGIEFEVQFDERLRELLTGSRYDELFASGERRRANTNQARLIEVVRLLSPILSASWRVMHNLTSQPLVLNDRGFALYHLSVRESFYGLPLTPDLMLLLRAGPAPPSPNFESGEVTGIEHREMSAQDVKSANRGTFGFATREVYGPTFESLEALGDWPPAERLNYTQLIGADALITQGFDLRFHESDWFAITGRFRAEQNYLPPDPGFPALIRMDLPMLPTQASGLTQRMLDLAETTLHEGRGELALDHTAAVAERDSASLVYWLQRRLKVERFGHPHWKSANDVREYAVTVLDSPSATAYEACAAALRLALIEAGIGRTADAAMLLRRAAVTARKDPSKSAIRAAVVMAAIGQDEEAVDLLNSVAKSGGPSSAEALCRLGELLVSTSPESAWSYLRGATQLAGDEWIARAWFRLGDLYRQRSDRTSAIECYEAAESTNFAAWASAAAYNHGVYLMELGEPKTATRIWGKGFAYGDPYWKSHCATALGGHLFSIGDFAHAERYLHFATVSRVPEFKDAAALNFGVVLFAKGEYSRAKYWLEQVVAEATGDLPLRAMLNLADIEDRQGDVGLAIDHLASVAAGDSKELAARAMVRWGRILTARGQSDEAAQLYRRALALAQSGPSERAALELANMAEATTDFIGAQELAAIAAKSPDADVVGRAANLAGICSHKLGDANEATRWYRVALNSADVRQSAIGQANLGGMLIDQGKETEGIRHLNRAKERGGPGEVFARLNLADYWSKHTRTRQAERELQAAMTAQGGRYRVQAAVPYAKFLAAAGHIREARRIVEGVVSIAGPKQRKVLDALVAKLRDAPETGPVDLDDDFTLYVETEDEIRVPTWVPKEGKEHGRGPRKSRKGHWRRRK